MLRFLDFLFAALGLLLFSPVIALLALISLFDTGSPLFRQQRVGRYQRPFVLVKFRTMRQGTASVAWPTWLMSRPLPPLATFCAEPSSMNCPSYGMSSKGR